LKTKQKVNFREYQKKSSISGRFYENIGKIRDFEGQLLKILDKTQANFRENLRTEKKSTDFWEISTEYIR